MELTAIFKALGEDIRLRMMGLLLKRELCVCDIELVLGISQANASRHLGKLKSAGILTSRKDAQWVYYDVSSKFRENHPALIEAIRVEVRSLESFKNDIKTLAAVKKSKQHKKC